MDIQPDVMIEVKRIHFAGNALLSSDQLHGFTAPFENRTLGATELKQLTHAVSEGYRQSGWGVNVYVPRQRLSEGELTLQIIETPSPRRTP